MSLVLFIYLCLMFFSMTLVARRPRMVERWLPLTVTSLSFLLTMPSLILFRYAGVDSGLLGFKEQDVLVGAGMCLLFAAVWCAGYFPLVMRAPIRNSLVHQIKGIRRIPVLLIIPLLAYLIHHGKGLEYGWSQQQYAADPYAVGSYGLVGGLASLMMPMAAAGLYLIILVRQRASKFIFPHRDIYTTFFFALICLDLAVALISDMQRGDIAAVILVVLIIMVRSGMWRWLLVIAPIAFAAVVFVSPILDYLRNPNLGAKDLTKLTEAIEFMEVEKDVAFSPKLLFEEPARKAILAASTFSLIDYAQNSGYVGFSPYLNSFAAVVPRSLWRDKPVAESADGKMEGRAANVAARHAGYDNVWWVSGAGVLYWEFGLIGVVLGAIFSGVSWAVLGKRALQAGHLSSTILFFWAIQWGLPLIYGGSSLINVGAEYAKLMTLPFALLVVVLMGSRASGIRNNLRHQ